LNIKAQLDTEKTAATNIINLLVLAFFHFDQLIKIFYQKRKKDTATTSCHQAFESMKSHGVAFRNIDAPKESQMLPKRIFYQDRPAQVKYEKSTLSRTENNSSGKNQLKSLKEI
jgi:hypothetical protein